MGFYVPLVTGSTGCVLQVIQSMWIRKRQCGYTVRFTSKPLENSSKFGLFYEGWKDIRFFIFSDMVDMIT